LVGLVTIAALLVHISRLNKRTEFAWAATLPEPHEAEPSKNKIEELVDSIQASYGSRAASTRPKYAGPANDSALGNSDAGDLQAAAAARLQRAAAAALGAPSVASAQNTPSATPARAEPLAGGLPSLEDSNSSNASSFNFFSSRSSSVKVEEISDVTQEAEFWMSVNDPQRAIEILEPQAAIEVPDSPVPWLYLLDLYRVTKNQDKYDALRDRFIMIFNAHIPDFDEPDTGDGRQLMDFEHLMNRICGMWATNDILPFLQSLLIDDRDGKRMGFELPVYRDILLLISVAHELERMRAAEQAPSSSRPAAQPDTLSFESIEFEKPSSRHRY
jgi:hypothetical protein